jgi:hypothetical protein
VKKIGRRASLKLPPHKVRLLLPYKTHMYPVKHIVPIVFPKQQYKDRFGEPNAFVDMNPSMFIRPNGEVTLLVRRVNYRKYADKQFSLGSYPSQSKYLVATGNVADLTRWHIEPLHVQYGTMTYPTYWTGPEDIRFITENQVLATIPECNPSGQPAIFEASLEGFVMNSVKPCHPRETEKNWMPYTDSLGKPKVIYSLSPFRTKDIRTAETETVNCHLPELEGYHGSTNGVPYMGDNRLFLIHINRERTYHRWLLFHPSDQTIQVSDEFVFFQHSYIEFPLSLCDHGGKLYVSLGVNDEAAYILEIDVAPTFQEKLIRTLRV